MKRRLKLYFWNLLIALDQLANALLAGEPDETLSARTHRKADAGQWFWRALRWVIDLAMLWESRNHCRVSYEREVTRAHLPQEYRRAEMSWRK